MALINVFMVHPVLAYFLIWKGMYLQDDSLSCTYLSITSIMLIGYRLFIEVKISGKSVCVADFNPYCAGVIEQKMKCTGYCLYLQFHDARYRISVRITVYT